MFGAFIQTELWRALYLILSVMFALWHAPRKLPSGRRLFKLTCNKTQRCIHGEIRCLLAIVVLPVFLLGSGMPAAQAQSVDATGSIDVPYTYPGQVIQISTADFSPGTQWRVLQSPIYGKKGGTENEKVSDHGSMWDGCGNDAAHIVPGVGVYLHHQKRNFKTDQSNVPMGCSNGKPLVQRRE